MKILGTIVWLITAVASIGLGLVALGYNMFAMQPFMTNPNAVMIAQYVIGISGVLSLLMFFGAFGKGACGCSCGSMNK